MANLEVNQKAPIQINGRISLKESKQLLSFSNEFDMSKSKVLRHALQLLFSDYKIKKTNKKKSA